MALLIEKEVNNTGLILNYHKVRFVLLETDNDFVEVQIGVYPNMEASKLKKEPVTCYYARVPVSEFKLEENLIASAYMCLKKCPEFQGAEDA